MQRQIVRKLDRLRKVELANLNYLVSSILDPNLKPRNRRWITTTRLDQKREGACVGFGFSAELAASPVRVKGIDNEFARQFYYECKTLDGIPHLEGTYVQTGAQVARRRGYITSWRWCMNVMDVILTLGHVGPIVIGVDWYTGMWDTSPSGFIRPTGVVEGGHCVMLMGVQMFWLDKERTQIDYMRSYVIGMNNWNESWGQNGFFKLSLIDLTVLFPGGDFCVPLGRSLGKAA